MTGRSAFYSPVLAFSAHNERSRTRNHGYADVIFVMTTCVRLPRQDQRGTERADRGTDCVRAVKGNIALEPMKAHFSLMSWRFLLLMSCIHGLSGAAKCRGEFFLCLIKSWTIVWPKYLECKPSRQ